MKVFGIGLPRTGTSSLSAALASLGCLPSLHNPRDVAAIAACGAATDITIACRFAQLAVIWPDARFILTTRPSLSWLDSCARHYGAEMEREAACRRGTAEASGDWFGAEAYLRVFGARTFEPRAWARIYREHERAVARCFHRAPWRLLKIDITAAVPAHEKWAALAGFLGLAVPRDGLDFPHENRWV